MPPGTTQQLFDMQPELPRLVCWLMHMGSRSKGHHGNEKHVLQSTLYHILCVVLLSSKRV
jgi:hypothetical protein